MSTKHWRAPGKHWRDIQGVGRREVMVHHLKCAASQFDAIVARRKFAEYRCNDRPFEVGDIIVMHKLNSQGQVEEYSPKHAVEIFHIVEGGDYGIPAEYCMLSVLTYNGLTASAMDDD